MRARCKGATVCSKGGNIYFLFQHETMCHIQQKIALFSEALRNSINRAIASSVYANEIRNESNVVRFHRRVTLKFYCFKSLKLVPNRVNRVGGLIMANCNKSRLSKRERISNSFDETVPDSDKNV